MRYATARGRPGWPQRRTGAGEGAVARSSNKLSVVRRQCTTTNDDSSPLCFSLINNRRHATISALPGGAARPAGRAAADLSHWHNTQFVGGNAIDKAQTGAPRIAVERAGQRPGWLIFVSAMTRSGLKSEVDERAAPAETSGRDESHASADAQQLSAYQAAVLEAQLVALRRIKRDFLPGDAHFHAATSPIQARCGRHA